MFRTWAEALAGHKASESEIDHIQRQLEAAYRKGREDMTREMRDLLGAKGEYDD
jgi:hypothetical protein